MRSLIICGARRCPPTKLGCVSSCVNEKSLSLQLMKQDSLSASQLTSPRSTSMVEELEKVESRSFVKDHKEYRYNKIQDLEHAVFFMPKNMICIFLLF